jgi:hypothetical protein
MTFQIDANHAMARATSLVEAVKIADEHDAETVLALADKFYAYITQESRPNNPQFAGPVVATNITPPAPVKAVPVENATPAPAKPAKAKPVKAAPAPKPELPASDTSKEEVGEIVSKLLSAKLREEAIGLLKKFKATSVSGVAASDYAAFVAEGKQLLGDAALAAQGEVEADIES